MSGREGKQGKIMGKVLQVLMIIVGNGLYALAVAGFIMPNQLITGGTTGLALFVNRLLGVPVSLFVSIFNITMFLLGAKILGRQFVVTTALSTVVYPVILGALEASGFAGFYLEEGLVAVLYAGILIGAGIGIVMRAGASTGGMDIPALILKKKLHINVSLTIYLLDCVVLGLQLTAAKATAILYGILLIIVYTMVLDKVLMAGNARMQVKIISARSLQV